MSLRRGSGNKRTDSTQAVSMQAKEHISEPRLPETLGPTRAAITRGLQITKCVLAVVAIILSFIALLTPGWWKIKANVVPNVTSTTLVVANASGSTLPPTGPANLTPGAVNGTVGQETTVVPTEERSDSFGLLFSSILGLKSAGVASSASVDELDRIMAMLHTPVVASVVFECLSCVAAVLDVTTTLIAMNFDQSHFLNLIISITACLLPALNILLGLIISSLAVFKSGSTYASVSVYYSYIIHAIAWPVFMTSTACAVMLLITEETEPDLEGMRAAEGLLEYDALRRVSQASKSPAPFGPAGSKDPMPLAGKSRPHQTQATQVQSSPKNQPIAANDVQAQDGEAKGYGLQISPPRMPPPESRTKLLHGPRNSVGREAAKKPSPHKQTPPVRGRDDPKARTHTAGRAKQVKPGWKQETSEEALDKENIYIVPDTQEDH